MTRRIALAALFLALGSRPAPADVTRTEAIDRAKAFTFYPWHCRADNLGAACDPDYETAYVVGDFLGVAYKWGGFDSLFQFSEKLADGYGAGTTTYDEVFGCMAGVDCSGFVSRVWNTGQKYGTSTFAGITRQIAVGALLPGDAFNDAGHHCALYSHMLASGEPFLYEAVYFNTHVNATGGWSYLDGFRAIRYDGISGTTVGNPPGTLSNPILADGFPFTDSRDTRVAPSDLLDGCGAAPGTNESGREFIYRALLSEPGMLTVSVADDAGADIDVHLYGSSNTSDCVARHDSAFTAPVGCGTYYVVADTYGANAGNYELTISFQPSGDGCDGGPPDYDPLGGLGDECAYPDHPNLPFCNPTLDGEVCLYTDSESFCSKACAADADCDDMPGGGGCCEDIGEGELYCLTAAHCEPPPDDGGDEGGDGDDGDDGGDAPGGGDPDDPAGPDDPASSGCAVGGGGAAVPVWLLGLLIVVARRRRRR